MSKYKILEVGQVYKSYRQVCDALGEKVEAGNSKKAQIKEWECHFSYEKQGNKFVILDVFDTPKEKEDLRALGKNSVYSDFIQLLILDYLGNCDGHLVVGRSRLMQTIGMVNRNYSECRASLTKLANYTNINIDVIYDFYNTTNSSFRHLIEYNLNKLVDKRIIMYDIITRVKKKEEKYTSNASSYQKQVILDVEKEFLEEMGFESMSKIRVSSKWNEFKKKVDTKLKDVFEIEYYYKAYDITINNKYIESEKIKVVDFILEKAKRSNTKSELNKLVINKVNENASKRYADAFTASKKLSRTRSSDTYMSDISQLANTLLNFKAPYKVAEIMKTEIIEKLTEDEIQRIDDLLCF